MQGPDTSPAIPGTDSATFAKERAVQVMERICGLVSTGRVTKQTDEKGVETSTPELLLVGWSTQGLPMITTKIEQISPAAKTTLNRHTEAMVPTRDFRLDIEHIVELQGVSETVAEFRTRYFRTPQDLIEIKGRDERGDEVTTCFTHLALLEGIGQAITSYFEDSQHRVMGGRGRMMAGRMFSLFLPRRDPDGSVTANAVIFRPRKDELNKMEEPTNEGSFTDFVVIVINKIIEADRERDKKEQRGYLKAVREFTKKREKIPGLLAIAHSVVRQGPAEAQREELQKIVQASRSVRVGTEKLLKAIGLRQQIDPDYFKRLEDPYSHPDLKALTLEDLSELASQIWGAGAEFYARQQKEPL